MLLQGLPPISNKHARVLILGSFPSEASLRHQQYYAYPRNQFWRIIEHLFGIARNDPYQERCEQLITHHVAVWDVIAQCRRKGSSDSAIREPKANNFAEFYQRHPRIRAVFWNGAKSEQHYRKLVGMDVTPAGIDILDGRRLPSTSPANAVTSLAGKITQWEALSAKIKQADA